MASFVDHLQILPMPHKDGRRQPDGEHRTGGLGVRTIADRLEERGWVARIEDLSYEKPMPEPRLVEAYARGLCDAVASAWDRNRFPLLLLRSNYGALGPVDALGEQTGVVWVGPDGAYARGGFLRRAPLDRRALAFVTGHAGRDRFAVRPVRLPGERVLVIGAARSSGAERSGLAADGVRVHDLGGLTSVALDAVEADAWYLHVDVRALRADAVPAADDSGGEGLDPGELARAIGAAFQDRPLKAVAFARYDLNRDEGGRTLDTLVDLVESAVVAAGGVPNPGARSPAS